MEAEEQHDPTKVIINSKTDVYWVVNPTLTDEKNRGEEVIKLQWGFDWDENQILMTKSMATMLRDSLTEILEKL